MVDPGPESGSFGRGRLNRPRSMLTASGILIASAVLMVIEKRGLIEGLPSGVAGVAGLTLGICGFLYLIYIWRDDRFRVSIGRLMIVVAIFALMLEGVLVYRNWLQGR